MSIATGAILDCQATFPENDAILPVKESVGAFSKEKRDFGRIILITSVSRGEIHRNPKTIIRMPIIIEVISKSIFLIILFTNVFFQRT
jgi:hypothetical protein